MNFVDKDGTTKLYIPFHPCLAVAQTTANVMEKTMNAINCSVVTVLPSVELRWH